MPGVHTVVARVNLTSDKEASTVSHFLFRSNSRPFLDMRSFSIFGTFVAPRYSYLFQREPMSRSDVQEALYYFQKTSEDVEKPMH